MPSSPLVAWTYGLPSELTPTLLARRRATAAAATGRVLDLGGWTDHLDCFGEADVDLLVPGGHGLAGDHHDGVHRLDMGVDGLLDHDRGPYDTILSLVRMPLVAHLSRFLGLIASLLADDGRLLLLEPVERNDVVGRARAGFGAAAKITSGLHLDRDVPALVRAAGFVITDLERFTMSGLPAPLGRFIQAQARLRSPRSSPS